MLHLGTEQNYSEQVVCGRVWGAR